MKLSAPTKMVFIISVVIAAVALIGMFISIPFVSAFASWLMTGAFILLALSNVLKGL